MLPIIDLHKYVEPGEEPGYMRLNLSSLRDVCIRNFEHFMDNKGVHATVTMTFSVGAEQLEALIGCVSKNE